MPSGLCSSVCIFILLYCLVAAAHPSASTGSWILLNAIPDNMTALAHADGQDTIIVWEIGQITGASTDGNSCWDVEWSLGNSYLEILTYVFKISQQLNMSMYIGLLGIPDAPQTVPPLWGACMQSYANIQGQVALQITNSLKAQFGEDVSFSWYLTQEPGLNFIQYVNGACNTDGVTTYYIEKLAAIRNATGEMRTTMISPFWSEGTAVQIAATHDAFMRCTGIEISAPQDGVGSFNRTITGAGSSGEFFAAAQAAKTKDSNYKLWANVETFMPFSQVCETAPSDRIAAQVASVAPFTEKIINYWSFNLPGAPPCQYNRYHL